MATNNINSNNSNGTMGGVYLHNKVSKCSRCYYSGKCGEVSVEDMNECEYFDSLDVENEDEDYVNSDKYIDKLIEISRIQYIEYNKEYMREWE